MAYEEKYDCKGRGDIQYWMEIFNKQFIWPLS